jgi:hypothetical protein
MCAAVALAGCAGMNGNSADLLKQLDSNFAGCDRHITFQAGVGVVTPGAQVSGSVDCKGAAVDVPGAAPSARPAP